MNNDPYGHTILGDGEGQLVQISGTVTDPLKNFHPIGCSHGDGHFTFFDTATDAEKRRTMAMGDGFIWHNAEMKGDGT